MSFEIKKATRQGVIPLIGLYSESGCGKTYSALLLARGFVGPEGKVLVVDTESRRASLYADVLPGGFEVLDLEAPFTPARYIEAIQFAEASGAKIIVVDSMSHEWEGPKGVCDMAGENEERSGRPGLHNWKQPKMEHAKLVQYLLRSKVPIICCIRAKYKTRQKKDEKGKTLIVKDEVTSPIQAEDFVFELTAHAELLPNHTIIVTKASHPTLRECFPKDRDGMITVAHGEALARWCQAAGAPSPASKPAATSPPAQSSPPTDGATVKAKTNELWALLKPVRGTESSWHGAMDWLIGNKILPEGSVIKSLTVEQLQEVIGKAGAQLKIEEGAP